MNWSTLFSTPIGELLRRAKSPSSLAAARPAIGATVCGAGLRMTVQAGMSDDLWQWLADLGWRELRPRENRLDFRPLSTAAVTRLFDCTKEERERVLLAALRNAGNGSGRCAVVPRRVSSGAA